MAPGWQIHPPPQGPSDPRSNWISNLPKRTSGQDRYVVHSLKDLGLKLQKWSVYEPPSEVMAELDEEDDDDKRAAILKKYEEEDAETNSNYRPYNVTVEIDFMTFPTQMLTSPRQKPKRNVSLFETLPPEVMMTVFTEVEDIFDLACLALSCKTMASFAVAYDWLTYPCKAIQKPGFNVWRQLKLAFHLPDNDYNSTYCFLERLTRGWVDPDKYKWCLHCMKIQPKSKAYWSTKQARIVRRDMGYVGDAWRKATEKEWLAPVVQFWVDDRDDGYDEDTLCPTCFVMSNPTEDDLEHYKPAEHDSEGDSSCCDSSDSDTDPYRNEYHKYIPYALWADANGERMVKW